jgi:hypothetical protein
MALDRAGDAAILTRELRKHPPPLCGGGARDDLDRGRPRGDLLGLALPGVGGDRLDLSLPASPTMARRIRCLDFGGCDVQVPRVDAAVIVALIALVGTVGNVALTAVLNAQTLFRFAQYFGWNEVLRRYMRLPDPRHAAEAEKLETLRRVVAEIFRPDRYGAGGSMMWREAQRAVGEVMVTHDDDVINTIGVAGFVARIERFRPWMARMEQLLRTTASSNWPAGERQRLEDVQARRRDAREAAEGIRTLDLLHGKQNAAEGHGGPQGACKWAVSSASGAALVSGISRRFTAV